MNLLKTDHMALELIHWDARQSHDFYTLYCEGTFGRTRCRAVHKDKGVNTINDVWIPFSEITAFDNGRDFRVERN
jgi:hypothetical protein